MKSLKEIKEELIQAGAITKLEELNKERNILVKLLNQDEEKKKQIIKSVRKKKHWTQLPKNKTRLRRILRESARKRLGK